MAEEFLAHTNCLRAIVQRVCGSVSVSGRWNQAGGVHLGTIPELPEQPVSETGDRAHLYGNVSVGERMRTHSFIVRIDSCKFGIRWH